MSIYIKSGSFPIAIETGRHTKPPTPLMNRICMFCDSGAVEDEHHILLHWHAYRYGRV